MGVGKTDRELSRHAGVIRREADSRVPAHGEHPIHPEASLICQGPLDLEIPPEPHDLILSEAGLFLKFFQGGVPPPLAGGSGEVCEAPSLFDLCAARGR